MPLMNQDLHADLFTRQQRKTSNYFVRGAKGKASRQQSTSLMMQLPTSGTADIQVKVKTRKAALLKADQFVAKANLDLMEYGQIDGHTMPIKKFEDSFKANIQVNPNQNFEPIRPRRFGSIDSITPIVDQLKL